MIWPLIDPINESTKSSSKLTAAAHVFDAPLSVGGRPEESTHPVIVDVQNLYEAMRVLSIYRH